MLRNALFLCWILLPTHAAAAAGLAFVESLFDEAEGIDGIDGAFDLGVSPDGLHLYVAGKTDDAVALFARDATTGALTFVEVQRDGVGDVDGLDRPVDLALSPDGAHLYVAGDAENAVVAFARNALDGRLTFLDFYAPGPDQDRVFDVVVSPSGDHLYAASFATDAILLYQRDGVSGALDFSEVAARNGVEGVAGLDGVRSLAASPDGDHLYAASILGDEVAVFSRDEVAGTLTFLQSLRDGVAGVDGIGGAREIAVSADGRDVYATGGADDAVAHFTRAPATGLLTFQSALRLADVPNPMEEANGIAVAPDGTRVYVTGRTGDAVVAFDRDPASGALAPAEIRQDLQDGVSGLDAAIGAALDPSGVHLYIASESGDSVAVFVPEIGAGAGAAASGIVVAAVAGCRRSYRAAFT